MTDLTPSLTMLKNELMLAFDRDHQRTRRRRRIVRTAALCAAATATLSGTALGAGAALGIIDLGGGASATQVTTLPVWNDTTGTFDSATANGQYVYELAGLGADRVVCGPTDPDVATFLTATRPLTQGELESLLDPSNPIGIDPSVNLASLGITGESGGCFPTSVAGPLGTPQTTNQRAAAQAWTQSIIDQTQTAATTNTRRLARTARLHSVTVIHNGRRTILELRSNRG